MITVDDVYFIDNTFTQQIISHLITAADLTVCGKKCVNCKRRQLHSSKSM